MRLGPWLDFGIRCVDFAHLSRTSSINNCFKNGILPIVLPASQVAQLFDETFAFAGYALTIDLTRQVVTKPDGRELAFDVQPFRKYCLVNGYDDIGLTLRHADKIKAFEAERLARMPWLAQSQR